MNHDRLPANWNPEVDVRVVVLGRKRVVPGDPNLVTATGTLVNATVRGTLSRFIGKVEYSARTVRQV